MVATIEIYYDFRSPYAYFTSHRLRGDDLVRQGLSWIWRPVSIDILLNLQAGREPWAPYVDTLSQPKRAHLVADVGRLAAYHGLPLRPTRPRRPNSIPALCLAVLLGAPERAVFNRLVFDALWQEQQDIADHDVLKACLARAGGRPELLDQALSDAARTRLANDTVEAYGRGVFGVPTYVLENEVFFGHDRLDLLLWSVARREGES